MKNISQYSAFLRHNYSDESSPKDPGLLLSAQGDLETYYSPFEFVNPAAKLCIVGITPGATQAHLANSKTAQLLREGLPEADAIRIAKSHASFGGAMRNNLVAMLDSIGLHKQLELHSCSEVFDPANQLVHFTSALMYPVFKNGKDYNGTPCITKSSYLLDQAVEHLKYQTEILSSDAMWLPLGPAPTRLLNAASEKDLIRSNRVLAGLPHPSGANAERVAVFVGRKRPEEASSKTNPAKLLAARKQLIAKIA